MSRPGLVRCKECNEKFTYEEWRNNRYCENPNCSCPNVEQSMHLAQQVIEKAKRPNAIQVHTADVPNGRDMNTDNGQYYYSCPKVMKITVTPPNATHIPKQKKR